MNPILDLVVILASVTMVFVNLNSLRGSGTTATFWTRLGEKVGIFRLSRNRSAVPLPSGSL